MRVVTGGVPHIPGGSTHEKMKWLSENDDQLRKLLLREPRGYPPYCCNILVPPSHPEAQAGYIILEQIEYPVMSGGNTISVATVLLETGIIPMVEPITELVLEAPAGLIRIEAACENGKVKSVTFANRPAFAVHLNAEIDVPELGKITVDVAWGGMFYVITDARQIPGLELEPERGREMVRYATMIRQAAADQLAVSHPEYPDIGITVSMLSAPDESDNGAWISAVTMASGDFSWDDQSTWTGVLDRCPSGTGTSAKMATMHAKGQLGLYEKFRHRSVLGIEYVGELIGETTVDNRSTVFPTISGRSWIFGFNTIVLDPDDPFTEGFTVGDIWA